MIDKENGEYEWWKVEWWGKARERRMEKNDSELHGGVNSIE